MNCVCIIIIIIIIIHAFFTIYLYVRILNRYNAHKKTLIKLLTIFFTRAVYHTLNIIGCNFFCIIQLLIYEHSDSESDADSEHEEDCPRYRGHGAAPKSSRDDDDDHSSLQENSPRNEEGPAWSTPPTDSDTLLPYDSDPLTLTQKSRPFEHAEIDEEMEKHDEIEQADGVDDVQRGGRFKLVRPKFYFQKAAPTDSASDKEIGSRMSSARLFANITGATQAEANVAKTDADNKSQDRLPIKKRKVDRAPQAVALLAKQALPHTSTAGAQTSNSDSRLVQVFKKVVKDRQAAAKALQNAKTPAAAAPKNLITPAAPVKPKDGREPLRSREAGDRVVNKLNDCNRAVGGDDDVTDEQMAIFCDNVMRELNNGEREDARVVTLGVGRVARTDILSSMDDSFELFSQETEGRVVKPPLQLQKTAADHEALRARLPLDDSIQPTSGEQANKSAWPSICSTPSSATVVQVADKAKGCSPIVQLDDSPILPARRRQKRRRKTFKLDTFESDKDESQF